MVRTPSMEKYLTGEYATVKKPRWFKKPDKPVDDPEELWRLYHHKQNYSDCQLVTALNAFCFLTRGYHLPQKSRTYEKFVDLVGARHGSAIDIYRVHERLGIRVVKEWESLFSLQHDGHSPMDAHEKKGPNECVGRNTALPLPLEMSVWNKHYGFHSVLAVDYEPITNSFRITNFGRATSIQGWILEEDLYMYLRQCKSLQEWEVRLFGLVTGN